MTSPRFGQVRLRPFQPDDLEPIVALWNACLPKDKISVKRFLTLFLLDPNFKPEGALVAEVDGQPIGFLQAMVRRVPLGIHPIDPKQGWITAFFVAADRQRQGVGRQLLVLGLRYLRDSGCEIVSCNGYAPGYAFPGVDNDSIGAQAFLESCGFRHVTDAVAMELPLTGLVRPQAVARRQTALSEEGICVRRFKCKDTLPLLAFAEEYFPYWHQSLIDGLQVDRGNVFVAALGEKVLGFAQWENPQTDPPRGASGRFGPFGVRSDLRGNGLGAVLFYTVIEHVVKNGSDRLWFGWAGGRNLSFYERAGCRITRRYRIYRYHAGEV